MIYVLQTLYGVSYINIAEINLNKFVGNGAVDTTVGHYGLGSRDYGLGVSDNVG